MRLHLGGRRLARLVYHLLNLCWHLCSLLKHFFPAGLEAGLMQEPDEWILLASWLPSSSPAINELEACFVLY